MENKPKRKYKPRAKKAGSKPRKPRQPKQPDAKLQEPIEITAGRPAEAPAKQPGGLLAGIGSLFSPQKQEKSEANDSINPLTMPSVASASSSSSEPLSPESERILASVPQTIGEDAGSAPEPIGEEPNADPVATLMAQIAFEPQDVQDVIGEFFDWLAERFESDHWKLTERQARMLGRPSAQLANSLWVKLQKVIPDVLSRWCEETPGATAFVVACGIVVVPKVTKQMTISRERAKAAGKIHGVQKPEPVKPIERPEAERPKTVPKIVIPQGATL